MRYFLLIIGISCFISTANAQFIRDLDGKPFVQKSYVDVKGTPYLVDTWSEGTVKLNDGTIYKQNMMIKYNEVDDQLLFKDNNNTPMLFVHPVNEFTITYNENSQNVTKYFRNGYNDVKGSTPVSYFQVIGDGDVYFLKKIFKVIFETKAFNSANTDRTFVEITKYYMVVNNNVVPIKNDKKSILAALPGKQQQVSDYLKSANINFKLDSDLDKIITLYKSFKN